MAEGVRYRFLSVVGEGGFGRVYRARMETDDGFQKDVAIKVLSESEPAPSLLKRFRDEAKILGLLRDRAIVTADPPIRIGGRWAVVMEFVDGVSLGAMLSRGPIPPGVACEIVGEVARALHHAFHQEGVEGQALQLLHRDIKPDNIQLTPAGEVKILDFGIARANFREREFRTKHALGGTPGYIAPERTQGVELPVGDVYSLGVVLHEAVTGIRPRYAPTVVINGTEIEAPLEDLEVKEYHVLDEDIMSVVRLGAWMRAEEATDRPSPRDVEDWCRRLRQKLPPPYLREWSESEVPHRNDLDPDAMIGSIVSQSTQLATPAGMPSRDPVGEVVDNRTILNPTEITVDGTPYVPASTVPPPMERSRIAIGALLGGGVTLIAVLAVATITLLLVIAVWSILDGQRDGGGSAQLPEPPDAPVPAPDPAAPVEPAPQTPVVVLDPTPPSKVPSPPSAPVRPRTVEVTLDPEPGTPGPAPTGPDPAPAPAPPSRTGVVVVRTIPSGGTVHKSGSQLRMEGGGYRLPVGPAVLVIKSADGSESTTRAVDVPLGGTVAICYNFDTNSACAQ